MTTAKVFRSGNSQAVRLPKEFHVTAKEVYIKRVGGVLLLVPKDDAWKSLESSLSMFSEDFMSSRDQPHLEPRELL
jgi:antitoxin VapB